MQTAKNIVYPIKVVHTVTICLVSMISLVGWLLVDEIREFNWSKVNVTCTHVGMSSGVTWVFIRW